VKSLCNDFIHQSVSGDETPRENGQRIIYKLHRISNRICQDDTWNIPDSVNTW